MQVTGDANTVKLIINTDNSANNSSASSEVSQGFFSRIFVNPLRRAINGVSAGYSACFIDGKKTWKEEKFERSVDSIINAFEEEKISLEDLKTIFKKNESSELQIATIKVIEALVEKNQTPDMTAKARYQKFVDCLEEALLISDKDKDIEYSPFLEKICFYKFTKTNLLPFADGVIADMVTEGIKAVHAQDQEKILEKMGKELHQIPLKDQIAYIHAAPQSLKAPLLHLTVEEITKKCNIALKPQRNGNVPYAMFDFVNNSKPVGLLRAPCPTMQRADYESFNYEAKATVTAEFEGFLEGLLTERKELLYISLQDSAQKYVGSEKERNVALMALTSKYNRTFRFVNLPHNSPFYHQSGNFASLNNADSFKAEFMNQMSTTENGFYFPDDLVDAKELKTIMDEVHADLYLDVVDLTLEERLNFIEFYYTRLTLLLLKKTKADYLMNSSLDSIEHSTSRNSLLHYLLLTYYQKETSEKHLNEFYTGVHASPLLVGKRALDGKNRLLPVLDYLNSDKEIRSRLRLRKAADSVHGNDILTN